MNFKIGEKIVCIDDSLPKTPELRNTMGKLVINEIYTVRGFISVSDGVGLYLSEVKNEIVHYLSTNRKIEPCYDPARFRKLDYEFADNLLEEIKKEMSSEYVKN